MNPIVLFKLTLCLPDLQCPREVGEVTPEVTPEVSPEGIRE